MQQRKRDIEFCPNCFDGQIIRHICNKCGHDYKYFHSTRSVRSQIHKNFRKAELPKVREILPGHIEKNRRAS